MDFGSNGSADLCVLCHEAGGAGGSVFGASLASLEGWLVVGSVG